VNLLRDIRFAIRQLRRSPGFTVVALLVLALGIGAATGMMAIVQSILVRALNYRDADRLVEIGVSGEGDSISDVSFVDFEEMQRSFRLFDQLGAYISMPVSVQTSEGAQMLVAPAVTANFFDLLGVPPVLGRTFRQGDDAPGAGAAIVSHEFWQHSMGARKDILGSKLDVDGDPYTVVGVMPSGFQFPMQTATVWTTLQLSPEHKSKQGFDSFSVLGRMKPGIGLAAARDEGEAFLRHRAGGATVNPAHFAIYPYQNLVTRNEKPALLAMLGACLVVLLIAVVNTANLQIARATKRETEIAMRSALGASRVVVLRQLVVENLILSGAGATLGWLLASGLLQIARHVFASYPRFDELRLDIWTFAGCLLLTAVCGAAAALAPAWYLLNGRVLSQQNSSAGRASRPQHLSGILVTAEVALTCMLLVAAGLFLQTFRSLQNVPLGFNPDHVTSFLLWPQSGNISFNGELAASQRLLDRLQRLSGVEAAGIITSLPVSNFQMTVSGGFSIPGHIAPGGRDQLRLAAISPGYFHAMQIPLLAGRLPSADDPKSALLGVVNHKFVENYFPHGDPMGQQIILDKDSEFPQPITIVGVVGDVIQNNGIGEPIEPEVDLSAEQLPPTGMLTHFLFGLAASYAVRTSQGSASVASDIRSLVRVEAPEFAIDNLAPLQQAVQDTLRTQRLAMEITSAFAWVALLLSAAGLYGVLAYLVGQRVREIGIRLALGATRRNVFALVFRQGLWMVAAGLAVGWMGALLATRWIRSFLFGGATTHFSIYMLVGLLVMMASGVAMFLPARRATRVDPMVALRYE
jgi:predicted permease